MKNYLKFRNEMKRDKEINLEESYLLEVLFDYYNEKEGYSFPTYENLLNDLKTKRREKVSKILKSLVAKKYIRIEKRGHKNVYFILKHLCIEGLPVDSNGKQPMDGQVHFSNLIDDVNEEQLKEASAAKEEVSEDEEKVIKYTNFEIDEVKALVNISNNDITKVMKAYDYSSSKGAKHSFSYTKWALNNYNAISKENYSKNEKVGFNNFEPRDYGDMKKLEDALLYGDNVDCFLWDN